MTCRECGKHFDSEDTPHCPRCGAVRTDKSGVIKSSTILISAGETDAVYRSVKEVPAPLRRKLLKSTNGLNSATILIADRRGRQEIARAIQNLPSSLQRRYLKPFGDQPNGMRVWLAKRPVKLGLAALLTAASGVLIWFLFAHK